MDVSPRFTVDSPALTRGFLFCDLRGYTAFVEANGDPAAADLLDSFRTFGPRAIAQTGGGEIRTEGDSFYVVFASASGAVRCGLEIVARAAETATERPDRPVRVGVGIHAGESVEQREGYVGSAVNIAARVCAQADRRRGPRHRHRPLARPDEPRCLRSDRAADRTLKGIAEPIELFAVSPMPAAGAARESRHAGVFALPARRALASSALRSSAIVRHRADLDAGSLQTARTGTAPSASPQRPRRRPGSST